MNAAEARAALRARLDDRLGERAAYLDAQPLDTGSIQKVLAGLARAVGRRPLIAAFAERDQATMPSALGPMKCGHWRSDVAAATWLIAEVAAASETPNATLFAIYDKAGTEAREACLRALNFVEDDDHASGLELIRDGGRTYLDPLLHAAWCHNPYSAKHLTDQEYRKAVLKALFVGMPVGDFHELEARADETLARSLCEFADERLAAGRDVPDAVWIVAARYPRPGLIARLIGRLEHPLPEQRLVAAKALSNAKDARALPFIEERLEREEDPAVKAALLRAREA